MPVANHKSRQPGLKQTLDNPTAMPASSRQSQIPTTGTETRTVIACNYNAAWVANHKSRQPGLKLSAEHARDLLPFVANHKSRQPGLKPPDAELRQFCWLGRQSQIPTTGTETFDGVKALWETLEVANHKSRQPGLKRRIEIARCMAEDYVANHKSRQPGLKHYISK